MDLPVIPENADVDLSGQDARVRRERNRTSRERYRTQQPAGMRNAPEKKQMLPILKRKNRFRERYL